MTTPIRIALIGAGGNTRSKHIPKFQAIDGVELVGVVNRSRTSSQAVADEFEIPGIYDRWEDAVSDPNVDAVCIGTWPYMHCPVTVGALEAGKHVLCEARMAMNAAEAHRMLDAASAKPELTKQLVPSPFMLGPDAALYSAIREGMLGEIVAVDVSVRSGGFAEFDSPMSWRQDREFSGLNVMGMGIFYEALMRWVAPARTVQATGKTVVASRPAAGGGRDPVDVLDHVEVNGELMNGATYRLTCSAVTGFGPGNAAWIYGTDGTVKVDFAAKKILLGRKGEDSMTDITPPPDTWVGWRVEEEFVAAIRGEEEVRLTTFEDGVRYMEFTQAVEDSRLQGVRIELPTI